MSIHFSFCNPRQKESLLCLKQHESQKMITYNGVQRTSKPAEVSTALEEVWHALLIPRH